MKTSKKLKSYIDEAKLDDTYWVEKAKLDFAMRLESQRKYAKLNNSDLAKRIKSSAAYITKIFRGDSNMTIESMVKLSRATGGRLNIEIVNESIGTRQWGHLIPLGSRSGQNQTTKFAVTNFQFNDGIVSSNNSEPSVREAA